MLYLIRIQLLLEVRSYPTAFCGFYARGKTPRSALLWNVKLLPIFLHEGVLLNRGLIIRLALLCTLWGSFAHAESVNPTNKKWGFWLLGGFSFTSNQGAGIGNVSGATGLSFGFGGEARLLPNLSLCLDVLNIEKGYSLTSSGLTTNFDLQYLEFPFTIKYQPASWSAFRIGPYLGAFLLSATREGQGVASSIKGNFKNDYGITIGSWWGFNPNQSMSVGLDVRFDLGLANILNDAEPTHVVKTRAAIAMATVAFFLK